MLSVAPEKVRVLIWDLPVRICHWGFVLLLPAMWWTADEGMMDRHQQLGITFLGLLAFRILWGFAGSTTARFSQFVKGPAVVRAYLRGGAVSGSGVGHNPLGALSVVALLTLMATQIGLGLIAQDVDGLFSGPLNHLVTYETGDAAREWHEQLFDVLLIFVGVHVAAILFYLIVRRDNLIGPMLSGQGPLDSGVTPPQRGSPVALLLCVLGAFAFISWVWFGAPPLGD
jgi:cytochrome b